MFKEETKEERLKRLYKNAYDIVIQCIGEDVVKQQARKVDDVVIDRAKRRNGECRYIYGRCVIGISNHMFETNDYEITTTLIHEILHTFKDTRGHDYKWKWYANKINEQTDYNITRCRTIVGHTKQYKYEITCENCGHIYRRYRISYDDWARGYYRCGKCKCDKFRIVDLDKQETIL